MDNDQNFDRILKPTTGGWPHITLAWTGKNLSNKELKDTTKQMIDDWVMKTVTVENARVNTFFHEKTQKYRHDVLLIIKESENVEKSREILKTNFPEESKKFNMMEPHITSKICWTFEEAEETCENIKQLLPITLTVTGVTID